MSLKPIRLLCVLGYIFVSVSCQGESCFETGKVAVNERISPSGFTGPDVPALAPLLGDYVNIGVVHLRTGQI